MSNEIKAKSKNAGVHPVHNEDTQIYNAARPHGKMKANVPVHHTVETKQRRIVKQTAMSAFTGSSFLNGGQITFKLDRTNVRILNHIYVQVKVTNGTGAAVVLAPTPSWIDKITISAGDKTLAQITGQQLLLSLAFLARDEFEQVAKYFCTDANYSTTGVSLASGASGVYYIPLYHLFSTARLCLEGLQDEIKVFIQMAPSSLSLISGSVPNVTEACLILKGYHESDSITQGRCNLYRSQVPYKIPILNFLNHNDAQNLAASTSYTSKLVNIKGQVAGLFIAIRASAKTSTNQSNYVPVASLDIQLAGGESIIGHYVRLDKDMKIECSELFPNLFANKKDWYFVSFTSDPVGDYCTGTNHGFHTFVGTELLRFTTPAGLASATYDIDCHALQACHLHVQQGLLSLMY